MNKNTRLWYRTSRGHYLLWGEEPLEDRLILTVENYVKWYALYLITPLNLIHTKENKLLIEVKFEHLEPFSDDGSYFCDHVPNPIAVQKFARHHDYHLDPNALEMIIGRWELETLETKSKYYLPEGEPHAEPTR